MNWKQLLFSGEALQRLRARRDRQVRLATRLAASPVGPARPGGPLVTSLAAALDAPPETVVLHRKKQGMYAFGTPGRYVRVARGRAGQRWLALERASWERLRALGLGDLVSPSFDRLELPGGWRGLIDAAKQPIAPAELAAALVALVPPMVACGERRMVAMPATIVHGHAMLEAAPGIGAQLRLPPLATLDAAFRRPQRVGFFHVDLKDDNIMRLEGRFRLNDLKSCADGRVLDLELLNVMVRHYPHDQDRSRLERLCVAAVADWRHPAMAPLAGLIGLPRALWGPIYLCHVIGQCHGIEKRPAVNLQNRMRALAARRLLRQRLHEAIQAMPPAAAALAG